MTFTEALKKAKLTPGKLFPMGDDEDSQGETIKRWDNTEHGEYISIELSVDGYLLIAGNQRDYFDGMLTGDYMKEAKDLLEG